MELVLEETQDTSMEWGGVTGPMYVWFVEHAGGTWQLEAQRPDTKEWKDISPNPNPFTEEGLWWFDSIGPVRYRLTGGSRGAAAFVSNSNGIRVETF